MRTINIPNWLYELNGITSRYNAPLYIVGGFIRDSLLQLKPYDIDLSGPAILENLNRCQTNNPDIKIVPESIKLGTLKITYRGNSCEYTSFRTDSYANDGSHRPGEVKLGIDIEQDALRRDFTVNALYYSLTDKKILDFSTGLVDIENKQLKTIREPEAVFREDSLRILRLARLSARHGFSIDKDTYDAAKRCVSLIKKLAPERIKDELNMLITADMNKGSRDSVLKGLQLYDELGIFDEVIPELADCRGVQQDPKYHSHDVLGHMFHSCYHASPTVTNRLAALFHDIGKPIALKDGSMVYHDKIGRNVTKTILSRLKYSNEMIKTVCTSINAHMYDLDGRTKPKNIRTFIALMGYDNMEYLIDLRRADFRGSTDREIHTDPAEKWVNTLNTLKTQNVPDNVNGVNIDGNELKTILGSDATYEIGRMKNALWMFIINHPMYNNTKDLKIWAQRMKNDPKSWNKYWRNPWIL